MKEVIAILIIIAIAMIAYAVIDNRREGKKADEVEKKLSGDWEVFGWMKQIKH